MYIIYGIFFLLGAAASAIITQYEDMDMAPDVASKIGTLSDKPKLEHCLIGCSQNPDCKSIVYDGSQCYLYATARGFVSLKPEEKAVVQISRKFCFCFYEEQFVLMCSSLSLSLSLTLSLSLPVCACVRVRVHVCVCACVWVRVRLSMGYR